MIMMSSTLTYELERLKAKFPGYEFTATLKESTIELDPMKVVKSIVAKLKEDYDEVIISCPRNTYDALAIIRVRAKPGTYDLAWYQNDDIGYVGDCIYGSIEQYIKTDDDFKNLGMSVISYIDGCRQLEYYIYY
jgi:hypothetical protein